MSFKENLKRLRESKGWTQAQAAERTGVPFRTMQNWEGGSREPRLEALKKLAAAYGVLVDELLRDDATPARGSRPLRVKPKAAGSKPRARKRG
jgi:transcriptional regulator with XRE-family HTH domain